MQNENEKCESKGDSKWEKEPHEKRKPERAHAPNRANSGCFQHFKLFVENEKQADLICMWKMTEDSDI